MANINLLPWREERRQELKKAFLVVLGSVALCGLLLVIGTHLMINAAIDGQNQRNNYLQTRIDELTLQVNEIQDLEDQKQELLDRMTVIQELQGNRPIIVRIFDELVRTLPDGAFYNELKRTNDRIDLKGTAESNNRISSLMRKVEKSEWFAAPNLNSVTAEPDFGEQASEFGLSFKISTPSIKSEEE